MLDRLDLGDEVSLVDLHGDLTWKRPCDQGCCGAGHSEKRVQATSIGLKAISKYVNRYSLVNNALSLVGHVPLRVRRPAIAHQALRFLPLTKARRTHATCIERMPSMTAAALPEVTLSR